MSRRAVVVKLGSSTLVDPRGRARQRVFRQVAADVAALAAAGTPVTVVSSGAIALGLGARGHTTRPRRLAELQAASAIGQSLLLRRWEAALRRHGLGCAQVLLTVGDIHRRDGYVNARHTLETLLRWGTVPVVNENDSTATDEITFGDNDALAAQVAVLLRARLLVLLTDIDGLYDRDPRAPDARQIAEVADHRLLADLEVDGAPSSWGSGGMRSKVVAAEMASTGGVGAVIASGHRPGALLSAANGEPGGTRFRADARPMPAYKLWVRYGKPVRGRLDVDEGARAAVVEKGTSLLAVGLRGVDGSFTAGDAVHICLDGRPFAVGISRYPAPELRRLAGVRGVAEAVHRDNLVVL
ncbi:MAG TPA: glutamate 5-kinase [Gaiellales bacterium]|nr:glutamate 5-kinase [Gaiellales bacterium]